MEFYWGKGIAGVSMLFWETFDFYLERINIIQFFNTFKNHIINKIMKEVLKQQFNIDW